MQRKVQRRGLPDGVDEETASGWIDALADRFIKAQLLDDAVFSRSRAETLFRQGRSQRVIRQTLIAKGVPPEVVQRGLEYATRDAVRPDLVAALRFARRRRLGPYSRHPRDRTDADVIRKSLGAFARAGFDYATARKILEAEDQDAAELLIEE